uniref:Uncharacterized protein n=1 Tax=Solanum lycopersicum TaxID=4081 RepID=A0A3Q7IUT0_SOLLC
LREVRENMWWSKNLDLHAAGSQGSDFNAHTINNTRELG